MTLEIIAIITGFALLIWGADRFVFGAAALANNLGISPLVIGLTIVGFGTSAPEMLVSAIAAFNGNPEIGVGNAIGSNIANIGLVIGITALILPISVKSKTLKREFPLLIILTAAVSLLLIDQDLQRYEGIMMLILMVIVIGVIVKIALKERGNSDNTDPLTDEFTDEIPNQVSTGKALLWLFVGAVVLLSSSKMLVWGAVVVAKVFGISDLIIGLTIIAIGTSLPELAASVMSIIKNEPDIAIGNILGSNIFNLLAVMGISATIQPTLLSAEVLNRDYFIMALFTVALLIMAYGFRGPGRVNRVEGGVLLTTYCSYMYVLYLASV